MALIGTIVNQGSLQGQINDANGYLNGVITNAGLLGGQVVAERGLKGEKGDKGDTGNTGNAATVSVGSVTTGDAGTSASVTNSGTQYDAVFDFTIPKGAKGDTGATGTAATIAVGTTTTGSAGTSASVTNSGTSSAAVFNFTIPKGDKGDTGSAGAAATIAVGTTTTGNAGTSASVTNSGTSSAAVFNFTIPKGDKGDTGATGHSPVVTASKTGDTTTIYVDGSSIGTIKDGLVQDVTVNGTSVLSGTTAEITTLFAGFATAGHTPYVTPSEVKNAMDSGCSFEITYIDSTYGAITANYFNYSLTLGVIVSNVLAYYMSSWLLFSLVGDLSNDTWDFNATQIAEISDIPSVPSATTTTPKMDGTAAVGSETTWAKGDHVHPTDTSRAASSHTHTTSNITDFPSLATVATSGDYDDLLDKPSIPAKTSDLVNDSLFARGHVAAFHGTCSTAAATAEKAVTCADFKAADLVAGVMILVEFDNTNSAAVADLKLNVNSTGAYAIKQNNSGTMSNLGDKGYLKTTVTYPFIFNGTYWVTWYDTNTNTIGYTVRTNGLQIPVKTACYRYRICFTSPDGEYLIPSNASTSTSATASKTVTTEKIDPFGRIIYYSYTTAIAADGSIGAAYQMQQYNGVTLGYSFNRTGVALTMTAKKPVYVKCAPQTDGSAIIDATTPFVQDLPTTEDGKIYIFLGVATAATTIEFTLEHPVYYFKKGCVRQYTNAYIPTSASDIGAQETLVSGTNIKTINSTSLLGSGDISITEGLAPLIGTTSGTTPSAVKIALREGRMVCLQATGTLSGVALDLRFTTWNGATDTTYGGYAIDIVASQTIAYYSGTYYLFELVGTVGLDWEVLSTSLAEKSDIPSNVSDLTNDSGYLTLGDLPIYNGGVS